MGFFDNLKLKKAAKALGLTTEEYTEFLSVEKEGITAEQYKMYLHNYKDTLKLSDYPKFLKLEGSGLMPADRIDYIYEYADKLTPNEYAEFLKLKELGFDLPAFKNYQKTDKNDSPEFFLAKQKFQGLDLTNKDIEIYLKKYTNSVTPEQYAEYLKFDNKVVNMTDYKKYLKNYADKLTPEEYVHFCKAKKTEFEFWNNGKKEKRPTDEMALKYAKLYKRLSIENFIEYYDIEHGYQHAGFDFLGQLELEAYASFLENGNKLTPCNTNDEYIKRDTDVGNFVIEFSKNYIRKNSTIENGVLKKYTGVNIDLFCVPDEVTEIPKNAIKFKDEIHLHFLFHNSFKSISLGKNIDVFGVATYFDDYTGIEGFFFDQCFPISMETFNIEGTWLDFGTIKAPISMKNCEALQDKEVEWFDTAKQDKKKTATTKKEAPIKTEPAEESKDKTASKVSVQKEPEIKAEKVSVEDKTVESKSVSKPSSKKTGGKDYEKIISKMEVSFPYESNVSICRNDFDRINNRIESMYVGEALVARPTRPMDEDDWDVSLKIYDKDGLFLGYCGCGGTNQLYKLSDILTVEASEVVPLSERRKGSKYALLKVKIDYDVDGISLSASLPKPKNKYTVKYSADGKSGSKKFPDLDEARSYVEELLVTTDNGYATILDEDGQELAGEGGVWC